MSGELQRSVSYYRWPVVILATAIGTLLFVPFVVLVATSWSAAPIVGFPPQGVTLRWYESVVSDPAWLGPLGVSLWTSALSTAIAVVLGTVAAIGVAQVRNRSIARALRVAFIIPIALPPIAYAVGLYSVRQSVDAFRGNYTLFILGEALLALPYVFVLVSTAPERLDPALRSAARTMGAGWTRILWDVELPILRTTVIGGAVFAFSVVFDEVVLAVFLSPVGQQTLPLKMLNAARETFTPQLTAVSTLVSILAIVVIALAAGAARISSPRTPAPAPAPVKKEASR